ncbi:helix-turn-helix domain-containing protein (plasmid) [Priestia megaterium]
MQDKLSQGNRELTGKQLRELRIKNNFKQEDIGVKVGMSNTTIANYELGLRNPRKDTLYKLADLYNTSVDYLLGLTDNPHKSSNEPKDLKNIMLLKDVKYDGITLDEADIDIVTSILNRITRSK